MEATAIIEELVEAKPLIEYALTFLLPCRRSTSSVELGGEVGGEEKNSKLNCNLVLPPEKNPNLDVTALARLSGRMRA